MQQTYLYVMVSVTLVSRGFNATLCGHIVASLHVTKSHSQQHSNEAGSMQCTPHSAPTHAEDPCSWEVWKRTVLPNGVATGLDIAFSNASYAFITLSFYTMCKSSAPLFLLFFAFLWGIETPTWSLAGTIAIISTGLLMLVAGEVEFDVFGFFLVITAACMSGLRWTITQILLQVRSALSRWRQVHKRSCFLDA